MPKLTLKPRHFDFIKANRLVMSFGLSEAEFTERELLLELQRNSTRWFSQEEFDRLKELSNKMFANAGSPHST